MSVIKKWLAKAFCRINGHVPDLLHTAESLFCKCAICGAETDWKVIKSKRAIIWPFVTPVKIGDRVTIERYYHASERDKVMLRDNFGMEVE